MNIPHNLRYTKEHEWIRQVGTKAVIGITEHAQKELGDITFIELPQLNQSVSSHQAISAIESVKAASDIYAPLGGTIVKVNEALHDTPELINSSPYEEGWICEIAPISQDDFAPLLDANQYTALLKESSS